MASAPTTSPIASGHSSHCTHTRARARNLSLLLSLPLTHLTNLTTPPHLHPPPPRSHTTSLDFLSSDSKPIPNQPDPLSDPSTTQNIHPHRHRFTSCMHDPAPNLPPARTHTDPTWRIPTLSTLGGCCRCVPLRCE